MLRDSNNLIHNYEKFMRSLGQKVLQNFSSLIFFLSIFFFLFISLSAILTVNSAYGFELKSMMCGRDINNDEIVDQDEMAACTGENNNFCPIEAVDCTATYGEVICPSGSTLNPSTDKCEAEPVITCATGYAYDTELDRCLKEPNCPYNGILNPVRDLCEIAITDSLCPGGYK